MNMITLDVVLDGVCDTWQDIADLHTKHVFLLLFCLLCVKKIKVVARYW